MKQRISWDAQKPLINEFPPSAQGGNSQPQKRSGGAIKQEEGQRQESTTRLTIPQGVVGSRLGNSTTLSVDTTSFHHSQECAELLD